MTKPKVFLSKEKQAEAIQWLKDNFDAPNKRRIEYLMETYGISSGTVSKLKRLSGTAKPRAESLATQKTMENLLHILSMYPRMSNSQIMRMLKETYGRGTSVETVRKSP